MDKTSSNSLYDVIVIGGGPAGLTAALYLARARYRVLVVEKERFGGQITITSEVVNYPGVMSASGAELTETMRRQAESFGAEFLSAEVKEIDNSGDIKSVRTERGWLDCFGILIATGAHPRTVGFDGEEAFKGRGVAYCATCDGEFFTGKDVFVVGGGFAAAEESVFLTKYARHVTILIREPDFTCAKSVADKARENPDITIMTNMIVDSVSGDTVLKKLKAHNTETGETFEYDAPEGSTFGVFVFAGYEPATSLIDGIVELDEYGYIVTSADKSTSAAGIYAAGDVCQKNLRQVVTAVGDGALAATELERYASEMQKRTGKTPIKPQTAAISEKQTKAEENSGTLLTDEMKAQLEAVFSRMESPLTLKLSLDGSEVSRELEAYMNELSALTDKLSAETDSAPGDAPCVSIYKDGSYTGLAFHGVPGGHEFTSFVLGLYNAAGHGQAIDTDFEQRIHDISEKLDMKVLVSLSCTMCPELVTSAQKIASMNGNVTAEVYDINRFPELRERYNVMSVPCLVINDSKVVFGRKNIAQLLDLIG